MILRAYPGWGRGDLFGPAAPVAVRLSIAIAASIALHAAIVIAVQPSRGVSRPQGYVFTARLAHADERRDQKAVLPDPGASLPAPPAEEAHRAGPPRDSALPSAPARPEFSAAQTQFNAAGRLLPAQRYYLASELDRPPSPLQPVEPENPVESGSREGYVVLHLLIDERGSVDEVAVLRAEPSGVFEKSALAAFGSARYSPGIRSGAAVKSQLVVEVQYRLETRPVTGRGY